MDDGGVLEESSASICVARLAFYGHDGVLTESSRSPRHRSVWPGQRVIFMAESSRSPESCLAESTGSFFVARVAFSAPFPVPHRTKFIILNLVGGAPGELGFRWEALPSGDVYLGGIQGAREGV